MPLTGDQKRAYQREYMRLKRAGKPTVQPKVERPPLPYTPRRQPRPFDPDNAYREIEHWATSRNPKLLTRAHRYIVEGLTLRTPEWEKDDGSMEDWSRCYAIWKKERNEFASTDPDWQEAVKRYKACEIEAKKCTGCEPKYFDPELDGPEEPKPVKPVRCRFCGDEQGPGSNRRFITLDDPDDKYPTFICEVCVEECHNKLDPRNGGAGAALAGLTRREAEPVTLARSISAMRRHR